MKDVNLEVVLQKPAGWKMTRPWEAWLVPHGKGSRLRGSSIDAPEENALWVAIMELWL
jgi:hypothetical protein